MIGRLITLTSRTDSYKMAQRSVASLSAPVTRASQVSGAPTPETIGCVAFVDSTATFVLIYSIKHSLRSRLMLRLRSMSLTASLRCELNGGESPYSKNLARPERFELPTPRFEAWCSIQLSYGRRTRSLGSLGEKVKAPSALLPTPQDLARTT